MTRQILLLLAILAAPALAQSGASVGVNYNKVAQLRWYRANQSGGSIATTEFPQAAAFDGANVWVTSPTGKVDKIRAADGALLGSYTAGLAPTGIACDGTRVWIANDGGIFAVNIADGSEAGAYPTVATQSGFAGVVFDGAHIWVTNNGTNPGSAIELEPSDGSLIGTYPVGGSPAGIAFDGTYIWVANQAGSLTRLLASNGSNQGTFPIGGTPFALAFDGSSIWATSLSGTVSRVRASDGTVTFSTGGFELPQGIVFDGANIWVSDFGFSTVTVFRISDNAKVGAYTTPGQWPFGMAFDGANVWVTQFKTNNLAKF